MAYSDNQFSAMQEEAVKRVREMQRRSRSMVTAPESEPVPENQQRQEENSKPSPKSTQSPQPGIVGLLDSLLGTKGSKGGELFHIGDLKIDEEKALIGLLIYILFKQGADVKLLLGLGYLLL